MKFALLMAKNLRRNLLRTTLTSLAVMAMVLIITLVWSILSFINQVTTEKSKDLKAIISEKWQIPSQMPLSYAASLMDGAAKTDQDVRPTDAMTWEFYGGTLDKAKRTRENIVFFFAMDPRKIPTMMDGGENIDQALVEKLARTKNGAILGRSKLATIHRQVGDRITLAGVNFEDIDLEFEIVGETTEARYAEVGFMNARYLDDALDAYPRTHNNVKHRLADKSLALVWLKVPDKEAFQRIAEQIGTSSQYSTPAVKCETASSGIGSFLDGYRDLLWGMRWLFSPAAFFTMALVVANAISISVRERRTEMAVMKVLGFSPRQILTLVLGESVLLGAGSGLLSAGLTALVINTGLGIFKFQIAFFPTFTVPLEWDPLNNALVWGGGIGAVTALLGSLLPAWSAMSVKVSDVFSKVA